MPSVRGLQDVVRFLPELRCQRLHPCTPTHCGGWGEGRGARAPAGSTQGACRPPLLCARPLPTLAWDNFAIFPKDSLSSSHWAFAQDCNRVHPINTVTVAEPRPSCTPVAHSSEESQRQAGAVTPTRHSNAAPRTSRTTTPCGAYCLGPSLKPCPPGFTRS